MTTIDPEKLRALQSMTLQQGTHDSFENGHCAMEVVAWLAGEWHSDAPKCACPVISDLIRQFNDAFGFRDATRTRYMLDLLPRLVGSAGDPELTAARWAAVVDFFAREEYPRMMGNGELSLRLRAAPEVRWDEDQPSVDECLCRVVDEYLELKADSTEERKRELLNGGPRSFCGYRIRCCLSTLFTGDRHILWHVNYRLHDLKRLTAAMFWGSACVLRPGWEARTRELIVRLLDMEAPPSPEVVR